MSRSSDISTFVSKRITVGLSSIVGVTVIPNQVYQVVKQLSGGTLEIGGATLSWGIGYPFTASEIRDVNNSGTFYLCANGATCIAAVLSGRTAGVSLV